MPPSSIDSVDQNTLFSRARVAFFVAGLATGVTAAIAIGSLADSTGSDSDATRNLQFSEQGKHKSRSRESPSDRMLPRDAAQQLAGALSSATTPESFGKLRVLVDQAAKFDPQGSFDTAMGVMDPTRRREIMRRVLGTWVHSDHAAALAAVDQVENLALRRDLLKFAVSTLAARNPEAAVSILSKTPSLRSDRLWQESFANYAKADPVAAMAAYRDLDHPKERQDALRGIAQTFAERDLKSAAEWADNLGEKEGQSQAILEVLRHGAESNPALAATQIGLLQKIETRDAIEIAGRIAEQWAETNVTAAVEWAERLTPEQRDYAIKEIASDVLRYDPDAAQAMASKIEDSAQRGKLYEQLARLHMSADAGEAAKWIADLPAQDQSAAWRGAATEWARTRPEEAAAFAMSEDLDPLARKQLIERSSSEWARIDPSSAATWASSIEGKEGREAVARVVETWSREDPQTAIEFVAANIQGDQLTEMTRRAIGNWTREDPAEAAGFVSTLEESKVKESVFRDVTERWMKEDSLAASEWVASLEPSPARDTAVSTLINRIERDDPEAAVQWAETITDARAREETYKRLLRRLQKGG